MWANHDWLDFFHAKAGVPVKFLWPGTVSQQTFDPITDYIINVLVDTPAEFTKALQRANAFVDANPKGPRIITINAWNEWTEGSCLEPDARTGMKHLEAIEEVFPPQDKSHVDVRDYGAKGDGIADDTAAIRTAMASLSTGSTLIFPKGTYKI